MEKNQNQIGFNRNKEKEKGKTKRLEDYLNKWVFFKLKDGSSVAGCMKNTDPVRVNLLPYQKMSAEVDGKAFYYVEENTLPYTISKDFIGSFGEISKEETENFCEYLNRKLDSEFMGQEQQKMNYIDFIDNQEDKQIITVPKNYNLNKLRY